jgi:beta-glucosidase
MPEYSEKLDVLQTFYRKKNWDNTLELNEAIEVILQEMSLDDKLNLIYGCGFHATDIKRLGIPPLNMSDASMGMRQTPWPKIKGMEPATAFPATIMLAATWSNELAFEYGNAVAEEFRGRGIQVLLGPGINIYRHPQCGRNFEYLGEDPYLVSEMVVPYIKGVQGVGVMAVVKHFAANNSENKRKNSNSVVDEKTLREIYLPGFEAAVKDGKVLGLMTAYNLLNGLYCGESSELIKDILRLEWGFDGLIMSDWDSIWHTENALKNGVDLEMPGDGQTNIFAPEKVKQCLLDGTITNDDIDFKVRNILKPCLILNLYDPDWIKPELNDKKKHRNIALRTAREGIVLLKNKDSLLPLNVEHSNNFVMLGPTAEYTPTSGTGSGAVLTEKQVNLADAFRDIFTEGTVLSEFDEKSVKNASAVIVCVGNNEGFRIRDHRTPGMKSSILEDQAFFNDPGFDREGEGHDRINFALSPKHNDLIDKCCALNDNVIVVFTSGGAVDMNSWIDKVKAVLWIFYPGEIGAKAAIEIIAGEINPSGKLPVTIEKNINDNSSNKNFNLDWDDNSNIKKCGIRDYQDVIYEEGLLVGYRHFDTNAIDPLFCFGHGLSYTEFEYSDLNISLSSDNNLDVSFYVKNIGNSFGAEIAQVYVRDIESTEVRPLKELKGFNKVFLEPNDKVCINITLNKRAFSFWSSKEKQWLMETGEFEILVGASSRDIRLNKTIFQSDDS